MTETELAPPKAPAAASPSLHQQGDTSMWVFVIGDLFIFGAYFVIFMIQRSENRDAFLAAQEHLNLDAGLINTLVLLTSSWFVALAVNAARAGEGQRATKLTLLGGLCGILFIAIKAYEWISEIRMDNTITSSDFFMYYYMLTGVHLFHVALGLVILGVVVANLRNSELRRVSMVESGAIYWHLVDLLWVVIFALIYVMR
ncbi:cytochrome c oxidase subunit 3 [Aldersonia kunmingensis]|uniref:cytochrome c oxidase subunit 3 n=1 Tax=Aldersonia kunmingensis TaxID=408066 RepID=UPI0008314BE2|nr:cytochrome c oxidase subunit 3 [Aldersonia kunmingensis]